MKSDLLDAVSRFRSSGLPLFVLPGTANGARRNAILAALPLVDYARIARHLELVTLRTQQVLYAEAERPRYVYFPLSAVAALLYSVRDGTAVAIAIVGNDGMTGLRLLSEATSSRLRAVVEIGGEAYRMPAEALLDEFRRGGALHELLLRYLQALFVQTSQTAVCSRLHSVEQQLCRWLILYLDRLPSNEVLLTHEMIGNALGVRRAGITKAAAALQRAGVIRYKRGRITVPDRSALQARGCECCAVGTIRMVRLRTDAAQSI
jgi:CRP-like cAMP-binding protein